MAKREKKVFGSHSEVAHIWAQQKQSEGGAGNMFFDGKDIYSYGRHFKIATFYRPDVVLFNSRNYSVSTNQHQSHTRRAIADNVRVYYVPNLDGWHDENVNEYMRDINQKLEKFTRKRSGIDYEVTIIRSQIQTLGRYLETFADEIESKYTTKESQAFFRGASAMVANVMLYPTQFEIDKAKKRESVLSASQAKTFAAKQARYEAERAQRAKKAEEHLATWLTGKDDSYYYGMGDIRPVRLRIRNDTVETTQGANIPLSAARTLWDTLKAGKPVHGMELGHYTVGGLSDGVLTVGCHRIEMKEIMRIAIAIDWTRSAVDKHLDTLKGL